MSLEQEETELQSLSPNPVNSKWRRIFDEFDRDGDGKIPTYEFRNEIRYALKNHVSQDVLTTLLRNADKNQDGFITVEEFERLAESKQGRRLMTRIWLEWYLTQVVGKKAVMRMQNRRATELPMYNNYQDDTDAEYEEQYRYCPPPLSMITASLVQIVLFALTFNGINKILSDPVNKALIYSPYRRVEAWRFISYMLVHGGWEHLLMNVFVQVGLGIPLELVHRWWRVLLIYLVGVVAGSLGTSITDPATYLAGASGGVYSIMLAHIATILLNWSEMDHPAIWLSFFLILMTADTGNAIYQRYFLNVVTKVGYAAHFFGALAGLLFGLCILRNLEVHQWEKNLQKAAILVFILMISVAIAWNVFFPDYFPIQAT